MDYQTLSILMEEVTGLTSCYLKIQFSDEIVQTAAGNYEWLATDKPSETKYYFESMYATEDTLLRGTAETGFWGMTSDKKPRKARKGERQYYEFLHTLISSKRRYPIKMLFEEPTKDDQGNIIQGDGTSFTELLANKLDIPGLLAAFAQAGKIKNVLVDDEWIEVIQPEELWGATIDLCLTVTEKDGKYTQTCLADKFMRTGDKRGLTPMEEQNARRPFVFNKEGSPRKVHHSIQPQDFTDIPF